MKTRPKRLIALACFLVAVAAAIPLQIMVIYGHAPWEVGAVLAKFAPLNWAVIALGLLTAYLVFEASLWLLAALPAWVALVFYNNWLVGSFEGHFSMTLTALASLSLVVALVAFVNREMLKVILSPTSRWWRTPVRKRVAMSIRLKLHTCQKRKPLDELYVQTFDLSESGAFIPVKEGDMKDMAPGTQCYVSLPVRGVSYLQCRAEIVRHTQGRGGYPSGVGIRFLGLSWSEQRELNGFLERAA